MFRTHTPVGWRLVVLVVTLLVVAGLSVTGGTTVAAAPPADFDKTALISSGLQSPTAFRFAPDGSMFIAEQGGAIMIYRDGALLGTPAITLSTASSDERGLLGIELDPGFATNHYLYAAYTHADNFDRLSRFTVVGDSIDPASEMVLLKSNQPANVFHHGGEVRFGADGKLYWGLGMNLYNPNSQNLGTIHGKILRINSDGTIPTDNPFYGTPGADPAVWAYGLRNPFRFDMIPAGAGANTGKPLVGDVGGSHWEEIDVIDRGGNYGWPTYEGACTGCPTINPLFAYPHTNPPSNAGSITGVTVNTGDAFPAAYHNAVFYGDYTLGFVRYAIMDSGFTSVLSDHAFDDHAGTPVQLSFGPDGLLYQLNIYPGALYRIGPSGGNRAPVAAASADVTNGHAPLSVAFSSAGSNDPDGSPITYAWDFRDGGTSTEPNPAHGFTADGIYDVTLTVSDGTKSTTTTVTITVGNSAPTATFTTPAKDSTYDAGDTIAYAGDAVDPEDGTLPDSAFSWSVIFHHADHVHPFLGPVNGVRSGAFEIPRNADNIDTTYYEIRLTVTDSGGLQHVVSRNVLPNLVDLTFTGSPAGAAYTIDGVPYSGTHTERAVVGVDRVVGAPSPQTIDGVQHTFAGWSDGGEASHTIRTPDTASTFQVTYGTVTQPPAPWTSSDIGARTVAGSTAFDDGTFTVRGGGNDIWGTTDEFRYVSQPFTGDGSIVARLTGLTDTHEWAKSGIMIKESTAAGSQYAAVAVTPGHGVRMQWNFAGDIAGDTAGGPITLPDGWLKLERTGNLFTASTSVDGQTWTPFGTTTIDMADTVTAGLFVNSHNDTVLGESTFDNVSITHATTPTGEVPAPWQRVDVGDAQPAGSAAYDDTSGTFTIAGGGTDIWQDNDQSSYVHRSLSGNGSIVARVTGQSDTDPWAKAGVMIKQSATAGSPYAAMLVTPANGVRFQSGFDGDNDGGAHTAGQGWVKISRAGDVFTGYTSTDGTTWTAVGSRVIPMSANATVGLFVNAHAQSTSLGTATFDHVSVTDGGELPAGWTNADIGGSTPAGTAGYANGAFSITGGGTDVWGGADQAQYAWQSLTGDGTIVARVTGLTAADAWTKAGIMIKASATAGDPYAALMVTRDNGLRLQSNFAGDIAGGDYTLPGTWLRLTRTGNQLAAYRSADGTSWTPVGQVTLDLPSGATAGLFVNAHAGGTGVATATFDNVGITATPAATLPAPWVSTDVGPVSLTGSGSLTRRDFTVRGSGNDIWGTTDEFQFVHQPLDGDGSIVARVTSQDPTDGWAKTGVMIKESTAAGGAYAAMMVTPEHGTRFQAMFGVDADGGPFTLPYGWVRLERSGNTVIASRSADGVSWQEVGRTELDLPAQARIGLFVNAHNGTALNTSTFTDVTVVSW